MVAKLVLLLNIEPLEKRPQTEDLYGWFSTCIDQFQDFITAVFTVVLIVMHLNVLVKAVYNLTNCFSGVDALSQVH